MPDLTAELGSYVKEYERANNSHDIDGVLPHIADDATYWFSDGSFRGLEEIKGAIERTFAAIQDEEYEIHDLEWVVITDGVAVCRYRFRWSGVVDGVAKLGRGRGTNVVVHRDGRWQMLHEHLSS